MFAGSFDLSLSHSHYCYAKMAHEKRGFTIGLKGGSIQVYSASKRFQIDDYMVITFGEQ